MRILFLSRWFPYPADNGAKLRSAHLIKHLGARHTVDLIAFTSEPVSGERLAAARRVCAQVQTVPYRPFQPGRWKALLGYFSPLPRSVVDTFNAEMQRAVAQAARAQAYDVVIASAIDMAPYALTVPDASRVLEELELTKLYDLYREQRRPLDKLRAGWRWRKTARYVAGLLRNLDVCTVVSEREHECVIRAAPGCAPVHVVPNGIDLRAPDFGLPQPGTLIYSGALTYKVNWEAVEFFLRDVWPRIRAGRPDVRLAVTGQTGGLPLERLPGHEQVTFTGWLPDVREAVARSWVSVAPLLTGGGTRLKILEALALGTPVVSTSKGAEGLDLKPGRDILIADAPDEFAAAVLRVLQDAGLRADLSRNGLRAAAQYDWERIGPEFCALVEKTARSTSTAVMRWAERAVLA